MFSSRCFLRILVRPVINMTLCVWRCWVQDTKAYSFRLSVYVFSLKVGLQKATTFSTDYAELRSLVIIKKRAVSLLLYAGFDISGPSQFSAPIGIDRILKILPLDPKVMRTSVAITDALSPAT